MKHLFCAVISAVLVLAMAISACAAIVPVEHIGGVFLDDNFTLGDANDDGEINALDSYAMKNYITADGEVNTDACDINSDGTVSASDVFYMKGCLAGQMNLSDYEQTTGTGSFTIAGAPISDFEIVYDDGFVLNADNATGCGIILRTFVQRATGVDLQDVIGEENRTKPHMIRIVRMDPLGEGDKMGLGLEDYIYEVKGGDLYIYGTLRGNLYAAYEIVEEYLGFRFYTSYEVYEYEQRTADIPEGTYVYHPVQLEWRFSGQQKVNLWGHYYANRLNCTFVWCGGGANVGYTTGSMFDAAHSFLSTYQMGKGYEYLIDQGMTDEEIRGNLWYCWSSGAPFAKGISWEPCASDYGDGSEYAYMVKGMFLLQDLKAYEDSDYRLDLGINKVSFSHNDNTNGCQCKFCRAKYTGSTVRATQAQADKLMDGYSGEVSYDAKSKMISFKAEGFTGAYLDLVNRGAKAFQAVYPGAEVWTIIYVHTRPETVRPGEKVSILYCGHACMQHPLGSGECGTDTTVLGDNNNIDEANMKWWADIVHADGGHIWFWSYGVSYNYYFAPCPDLMDEWNNYHYLYQVCGFDGGVYEACSCWSNFERVKAYMACKMMWEPDMTFEEFVKYMKEYLRMYYGDGYEDIYEYIQMQQAAGDATGHCFITNHDRPWDYYSWQYLADNYDTMRGLLESAYDKADTDSRKERVQLLIFACDFMGISSSWDKLYLNGDAASKKLCEDRLNALYNYYSETELPICGYFTLPEEMSFEECPMNYFYKFGAWRTENIPSFAK